MVPLATPESVRDLAIVGELSFEQAQVFAENEVTAIEHPGDRRLDVLRDGRALRPEIDEWDRRQEFGNCVHEFNQSCLLRPTGITRGPA